MADKALTGHTILVAEDEYYAATDLERELVRLGAAVAGPAPSLDMTLDLIQCEPRIDAAVLDVNLGGEMTFPAADLLQERGVPFLFATGYDQSEIPKRFETVLRCEKPVTPEMLAQALAKIISRQT